MSGRTAQGTVNVRCLTVSRMTCTVQIVEVRSSRGAFVSKIAMPPFRIREPIRCGHELEVCALQLASNARSVFSRMQLDQRENSATRIVVLTSCSPRFLEVRKELPDPKDQHLEVMMGSA